MPQKKNIGLFFGTFNPIHVGHLVIANYMAQLHGVSQIWFVVSPLNPLKNKASILPDYHRLRLVNEAIFKNTRLQASDIEFQLPQPSYTIDTLTYLEEKYPDVDFMIIMGEDNLRTLPKWKNYKAILQNYSILVYPRVHTDYDKNHKSGTETLDEIYTHPNVKLCSKVPVMTISASFIRQQIQEGKDVRYLLTPPVKKYIEEMHFYEK